MASSSRATANGHVAVTRSAFGCAASEVDSKTTSACDRTQDSFLSSCWSDDERMNNLMAVFRNRDVNPADWNNKMKFWVDAILKSCEHFHNPLVSLATLQQRFRRKSRTPAGLRTVLEYMERNGQMQALDSFRSESGWIGWSLDTFVKRPISWLFGLNTDVAAQDTAYVCLPLLKRISQEILERHYAFVEDSTADPTSPQAHVVDWHTLRKRVSDICPDELCLELALTQLQREQHVIVSVLSSGNKAVKFKDQNQMPSKSPAPVTEVDTSILQIASAQQNLESEIYSLDTNISKLEEQARQCLRQGSKAKAKVLIKKKLLAQKELQKKEAALEKLHSISYNLQNTHSQKRILDAYKAGASAFKQTLNESGMSPDKVDRTIDDIHEAFEDQEEMAAALSAGLPFAAAQSDSELEAELESLLAQSETNGEGVRPVEKDAFDFLQNLPEVPSSAPVREKQKHAVAMDSPFASTDSDSPDRLKRLRAQLQQQ